MIPSRVYREALLGFSARLSPAQLRAAQADGAVAAVEADQLVVMQGSYAGAPWHLDRLDQRALPLNGVFGWPDPAVAVNAYVIDSGLWAGHPDFGGRAANVWDAFGGNGTDCNGHGTHVAGTIGSTTYGVAGTFGSTTYNVSGTVAGTYSGVMLKGVRVLGCSGEGSLSDYIAAVDWVRANAVRPAVASMAVATGYSAALNAAVNSLAASGVFVAVSAGDGNGDACRVSPASAADAFTVAATGSGDVRWSGSNHGPCVDAYAPGVAVASTWPGGGTNRLTGTSQAAGVVAGVAALYKAKFGDTGTTAIDTWIRVWATQSAVTGNPTGTPNRLVYIGADAWQ
ncbi:MAG TPA: S8 family peptidase [Longimicrobium sp.]